ncbi:MAG: GNVR domain-containing protein [Candidatus Korobacteraceae bacterium]
MAHEGDHVMEPAEPLFTEANGRRPKADVDLIELLTVLALRKAAIIKFTLGITLLALIVSLLLPVSYMGKTLILPPQQSQSLAGAMLGQLGALAGLGKELGVKSSVDLYLAMLSSESVENGLIQKFDLLTVYRTKKLIDCRKVLEAHTVLKSLPKEGLISISVTDRDPKRAADLANGYVEELEGLSQRMALTESSQRRLFFEKQLQQAKENLITAEQTLRQTQEKTGLLVLDSQARSVIDTVAHLKAQIAAKEVQLHAMRTFATAENPDLVLGEQQLAGLHAQLEKTLKNNNVIQGDVEIPTSKLPASGLAYVRAYRDMKYNETIYEIVAKQYEAARLDESKSAPLAQVVDAAAIPERKSFPKRSWIVLIAFAASFLLSCAYVIVQTAYRRFIADLRHQEQINVLKSHLRFRL